MTRKKHKKMRRRYQFINLVKKSGNSEVKDSGISRIRLPLTASFKSNPNNTNTDANTANPVISNTDTNNTDSAVSFSDTIGDFE